ncbi:J domain-containing protein [Peristeroidobacter agariperforans]|uniref:J domain-containing protein n=1 Tax=Peristeroidobacter agariperforans TaxID=268404 RepID=UPI00101B68FB|nr:J domain-containing protein [Peristeroidobacter agariperforans]
MRETPWTVLGIEPTTDERAIKRAYASLLKVTSPEKDPAGYMKLREAYERAKQHAEYLALRERSETEEEPDESHEADAVPTPEPEPVIESPQRRAFAELHALLDQGQGDAFLEKLAAIKAENLFATLDEQYFFTGEVARLIQEFKIDDVEWCGRAAELLGAREHENIFDGDPRYWYAYQEVLRCYSALLANRAQAHLDQRSGEELAPGYLHVYHVLTAPFDAERLSALTRSQTYSRLAERILERARSDMSIAIPAENREWWERTAMAGQHQPVAEPASFTVTGPIPVQNERRFPFWAIWVLFVVLAQFARACSDTHTNESATRDWKSRETNERFMAPQVRKWREDLERQERESAAAKERLDARLTSCDEETREAILTQMYIAAANKRFEASSDTTKWQTPSGLSPPGRPFTIADAAAQLPLDESDPVIAALLDKCRTVSLYADPGKLIEKP